MNKKMEDDVDIVESRFGQEAEMWKALLNTLEEAETHNKFTRFFIDHI